MNDTPESPIVGPEVSSGRIIARTRADRPAEPASRSVWRIVRDDQPVGPFTVGELKQLAQAGIVTPATTLVHLDGRTMPATDLALFEPPLLDPAHVSVSGNPVVPSQEKRSPSDAIPHDDDDSASATGWRLWWAGMAGFFVLGLLSVYHSGMGTDVPFGWAVGALLPSAAFLIWLCWDVHRVLWFKAAAPRDVTGRPSLIGKAWMWGALPLLWASVVRPFIRLVHVLPSLGEVPPLLNGLSLLLVYGLPLIYLIKDRPRFESGIELALKNHVVRSPLASERLRSGSLLFGWLLVAIGTLFVAGVNTNHIAPSRPRQNLSRQPETRVDPGDALHDLQARILAYAEDYDAVNSSLSELIQKSSEGQITDDAAKAELEALERRLGDAALGLQRVVPLHLALEEPLSSLREGFEHRRECLRRLRSIADSEQPPAPYDVEALTAGAKRADECIARFRTQLEAIQKSAGRP